MTNTILFSEILDDDDDDVLLSLADSLTNFLEHIGGPAYAPLLFSTFESLGSSADSEVREKVDLILKAHKNNNTFIGLVLESCCFKECTECN